MTSTSVENIVKKQLHFLPKSISLSVYYKEYHLLSILSSLDSMPETVPQIKMAPGPLNILVFCFVVAVLILVVLWWEWGLNSGLCLQAGS
jgi:hypothetical protein